MTNDLRESCENRRVVCCRNKRFRNRLRKAERVKVVRKIERWEGELVEGVDRYHALRDRRMRRERSLSTGNDLVSEIRNEENRGNLLVDDRNQQRYLVLRIERLQTHQYHCRMWTREIKPHLYPLKQRPDSSTRRLYSNYPSVTRSPDPLSSTPTLVPLSSCPRLRLPLAFPSLMPKSRNC